MSKESVTVFGANGYAGEELVEILQGHPQVGEVTTFGGRDDTPEDIQGEGDAFLALPSGPSGKIASRLAAAGRIVVDLSGDLRFETPEQYQHWYDQPQPAPELLPAPYCLPEMNRAGIIGKRVLSIPGCYPTATLLGIKPLVTAGVLGPGAALRIDAVSGVSGRGKTPTERTHFAEVAGEATTYNAGRRHRHVGEIEQFTPNHDVFFSPDTIPIVRGMKVKTNAELRDGLKLADIEEVLQDAYRDEPLITVLDPRNGDGAYPTIAEVVRRDICSIGFIVDRQTQTVQVISTIDNLRKGAAGQAVQAWNIAKGFNETDGLRGPRP